MNQPIVIRINGQAHSLPNPVTLAELLEQTGMGGKPVVVEFDEQAVFPKDYPQVMVRDGSRIEIVILAAGG